ncbi:type II secretion system protein [Massilia sp.]|uniref:pilus assembly FimT family protein n=1 Tax=Massilia sp. TaxID=1882437 RepID=UPI0028A2D892|nr:type II secretion system protein [Massilia sp.]
MAGLDIPPHVAPSHGRGRGYTRDHTRRHRGFTAVELILVIVLVGIVSAVAMTRFFDRRVYDAETATEQLRSILRYGQKIAIARHRDVFVQLAPNRVALCLRDQEPCAPENQVRAPGNENSWSDATRAACGVRTWMCEGRPANVTANANVATIRFDALGQPLQPAADGAVNLSVTITAGSNTRTVNVAAETGYVF